MPAERYYYPQPFRTGETIHLEDQEYHHLLHVMRVKEGESVEIVNGNGLLGNATVLKHEKKRCLLGIENVMSAPPPKEQLILLQGIPRQNRLDFIIEKGTELGVTEFRLFPAARGEKRALSDSQLERLKAVTIAAMKQCGRLYLPAIVTTSPLSQSKRKEELPLFYGDTRPEAPILLDKWKVAEKNQGAMVCIGPESGFSAEEIEALEKMGAVGVRIHPNILRTDTASLAALSLISHLIYAE